MTSKHLNYDEQTGIISDATGMYVHTVAIGAYKPVEISKTSSVDDLIKLKNAGFTASEIVEIKKAGIA